MGEFAIDAGALIINDKDEVLLGLRKNTATFSGLWSGLSGAVKSGEKLEEALKRGLREEAGVEIDIIDFLEFFEDVQPGRHGIYFGYLARIDAGVPQNLESERCAELKWFPIGSVPEKTTPYTLNSIRAYLEGKRQGKYGK